ncbi:MAG: hypothetical protein WD825_10050 [Gemmatimonadaceae bacterium]
MDDPSDPKAAPWTASRSVKEKNAVQRSVTALLDELAPERVLKRVEQVKGTIEQHRTPNGCVLQTPTAAVSVSWFAPAGSDKALGELHVVVWSGVVSRRGSPRKPGAAKSVAELILHPIERPSDDLVWRATNGAEYDTASLTAHCLALLEKQMGA